MKCPTKGQIDTRVHRKNTQKQKNLVLLSGNLDLWVLEKLHLAQFNMKHAMTILQVQEIKCVWISRVNRVERVEDERHYCFANLSSSPQIFQALPISQLSNDPLKIFHEGKQGRATEFLVDPFICGTNTHFLGLQGFLLHSTKAILLVEISIFEIIILTDCSNHAS